MILWGEKGGVGRNHDAAKVWADYASRIERTATVPSGHYLQEECPDETCTELRNFLAA
jgi:haloacetate dehalogenase